MIVVIDVPEADWNGTEESENQQPLDDIGNCPAWKHEKVPELDSMIRCQKIASTATLENHQQKYPNSKNIMY